MNLRKLIYAVSVAVIWTVLYSCASIGNPEGGPQDKLPPIFIKSSPEPNALNFNKNKIELSFDEIVTLDDPSNKIIVSPAQTEMPKLTANGKKVTIELIDTLIPNTTYTIDFSNSIQDNNEGNPLENFAFSLELMQQYGYSKDTAIVYVSNAFHCYRAGRYAERAGFTHCTSLAAATPLRSILPCYLREALALAYYWVFKTSSSGPMHMLVGFLDLNKRFFYK